MSREFYRKIRVLLLLTAFGLASCTQEDAGGGNSVDGAEITFSLKVPGTRSPGTRALSDTDEEKVETADVYVFDDTGKLVDVGYGRGITDQSTPTEIIRNFSVTLQKADERDVMVITNARELVKLAFPSGVPLDGTLDKDDFRQAITMMLPAAGWNSTPGSAGYTSIPMWGERKRVDIDGSTALTGTNSIKITRMTARVNVALASTLDNSKFTLSSIRVYNYNTAGRLVPDDDATDWQDATPYAEKPSLPQIPGFTKGPLEYLSVSDGRNFKGEIYLFEATKGVAPSDGNFLTNPCIVVGGLYDGSPTETFYRIDFAEKENGTAKYLHILRNNSYNITIKDVNGPGKPDEEQAYNSLPVNIDAEVVAWNEHDMNETETDGQYQLTVDKNSFVFYDEGRAQKMKIYTDYPYGWEIESDTRPIWLNVTPDNGTSASSIEVEVKPGDIRVNDPSVAVGDTLTYSFWITAGSIRKEIKIEQVNEPELTITVSPERLVFRRGAATAKEVIVTTYPDGLDIYLSEAGNVTWIAGGFPTSGVRLTNYYFHPEPMADGVQVALNTKVTMMVQKDGKMAWAEFTVMQIIDDILFQATTTDYPAEGGTGQAENIFFTVKSDARWRINAVTAPANMVTFDNTMNEPGDDLLYEFTLSGNPSFEERYATFHVTSDDPDFTPRDFRIKQLYKNPYITPNSTTVDLGSNEDGAERTVTVSSNARWSYTQSGAWTGISGLDFDTGTNPYGSDSAVEENQQQIKITPKKFLAEPGTPAVQTFTAYLDLESTNHLSANPATSRIAITRGVPSHFNYVSISGHGNTTYAAQEVTITAETNDEFSVRAISGGTTLANSTAAQTCTASDWTANKTAKVTVPATTNQWAARTSTIHYVYNGTQSASMGSVVQAARYNISNVAAAVRTTVTNMGGTYRITVTGTHPGVSVRAAVNTNVATDHNNTAGTATVAAGTNNYVDLSVLTNSSGSQRTLYIQWKHPNTGVWTTLTSVNQATLLTLNGYAVSDEIGCPFNRIPYICAETFGAGWTYPQNNVPSATNWGAQLPTLSSWTIWRLDTSANRLYWTEYPKSGGSSSGNLPLTNTTQWGVRCVKPL